MSPTFRELFTRANRSTPAPAAPRGEFVAGGTTTPYGAAVLARECETVAGTTEGGRNYALNRAAFKIGQKVPHEISAADALEALQEAGLAAGLPAVEVAKVLREGHGAALVAGRENQVAKADLPEVPDLPAYVPGQFVTVDVGTGEVVDGPPEETDDVTPERTSWWTRDLAGVLAGDDVEPDPAFLVRSDGVALVYPARVNVLLGESESGKTWVALEAIRQALEDGRRVLVLDFEDTASSYVGRLGLLNVVPDVDRFAYVNPDEPLTGAAARDLEEVLETHLPDLVVLDGWNAAMTLMGLNLVDNADATAFHQRLLRPIVRSTSKPALLAIDHVPKAAEARGKGGIGAQAKRGMVDGCAVRVEVLEPFGRGMVGRLRLTVDKDRPGKVREHAQGAVYLGEAVLTSSATGEVVVVLEAGASDVPTLAGYDPLDVVKAEISRTLVDLEPAPGQGVSGNRLEKLVSGSTDRKREALEDLVAGGYVRVWDGPKAGRYRTKLYVSLRPFPDRVGNPTTFAGFAGEPGEPDRVPGGEVRRLGFAEGATRSGEPSDGPGDELPLGRLPWTNPGGE